MVNKDWKTLLKKSCRQEVSLRETITLSKEEETWFDAGSPGLSLLVNPYFLEQAKHSRPLRSQCIPTGNELKKAEGESPDPLTEAPYSPVPRMIHRYPNRVAVLTTDQCAMHCRHCFRRSFTGKGNPPLKEAELKPMGDYITAHPEIREILLTGGDPLTMETGLLLRMIRQFRELSDSLVIRLATRTPSVLPGRIDSELARGLAGCGPLWVITQFNHPDELTQESRQALKHLREAGLPLLSQTVLLKGINDDAEVLGELFQMLLVEGVKPYYLFQGDLAEGTSHFRTSLEKGWEIMARLRQTISGLAMPVYAVDLPGGGGKIPLSESLLVEKNASGYVFRNPAGDLYTYPDERSDVNERN